jgi:TRAP-type transport system periplasmic protein
VELLRDIYKNRRNYFMKKSRPTKKIIYFFLCLAFAAGLAISYPTAAPAQPVIRLMFSHPMPPPPNVSGQACLNWAQRIENQSNGRVKITILPASAMVAQKDQYDALAGGVVDIGSMQYFDPQQFPLGSVITAVPGLSFPSIQARYQVWRELFAKFPEMQKELKGVKVLFMFALAPNSMQFVKKIAVHSPTDIKGMRIAAPPSFFPILRAWGAVEVDIPSGDRYMALDKGAIEGSSLPMGPVAGRRIYEVTKSTVMNTGALPQAVSLIGVNEKVWNRLPSDVQKIFTDNNEYGMIELEKAMVAEEQQGIDAVKKAGQTVVIATPEEYKAWTAPLLPLQNKWAADIEAKGLPAKAVIEEAKRLLSKYNR